MRRRIRIQPYVSPEIHRKLRAYSAANDLTDSAVAQAALGDFLEPDGVDEGLIMRRLDGIAQQGIRRTASIVHFSNGYRATSARE
jgi:hypothetical protein